MHICHNIVQNNDSVSWERKKRFFLKESLLKSENSQRFSSSRFEFKQLCYVTFSILRYSAVL